MSPKVLGFIKIVLGIALFATLNAILGYFSDAVHLAGYVSPAIATIIAGLAGMIEQDIQSRGGGALFGAVRYPRI